MTDLGKISKELAKKKAKNEYALYKEAQKEQEYLNSIKELDKDLRSLRKKNPPK